MFKDSDWVTHEEYCSFVSEMDKEHERQYEQSLFRTPHEKVLVKQMCYLNLDRAKRLIMSLYSDCKGRRPKAQIVLRCLILYVACLGKTGAGFALDDWVIEVKCRKELYVLCGCKTPNEVPEIGTLYDLLNRFWMGDKECTGQVFDARMNHRKSAIKLGEDNKIEDPEYKVSETTERYLDDVPMSYNYERITQQLLAFLGVYPSMENGCIPKVVAVSCDSSALKEHANPFGKCKCGKERMTCSFRNICGTPAKFSAPGASRGFDNGEEAKFNGQHVCIFNCYNPVTKTDLPICGTFFDANRHDSITFLTALQEAHRNVSGIHFDYMTGDKAYGCDEIAYVLLSEGTIPLCDLVSNRCNISGLPNGVALNKKAVPCCNGDVPMTLVENDKKNQCWVYGCPLKSGEQKECPLEGTCTVKDTPVIINPKEHPSIFSVIPREDALYQSIYKMRSGGERVNDRILNDYHLADIKTRNVNHRSFFFAVACILVHQDAWYKNSIIPTGKEAAALFMKMDKEHKLLLGKENAPEQLPPPEKGTKVDTEKIMDMLLKRNRDEALRESFRFMMAKNFYKELKKKLKSYPAWMCPKKAYELRQELGKKPLEDILPPITMERPLVIPWFELYFVKRWERTYVPYIPDNIIFDFGKEIQLPGPQIMIKEGVAYVQLEFEGERCYHVTKKTVEGFTRLEDGIWARKSPVIAVLGEKPKDLTPGLSCPE